MPRRPPPSVPGVRRPIVVAALVAALVAAPALPAAPALAAAPQVVVELDDPLMTDPLVVRVAVADATGTAAPFSATLVAVVGRTRATATVGGTGEAVATIPTARLAAGPVLLRVTATAGGRRVTVRLPHFAEIPPSLSVRGFSCAAVAPGGGAVRWAVDRMDGDPIATPNSRDVPLLPGVASSAPRAFMTTAAGLPMRTSGTVAILAGTRRVATLRLPSQVRRLVFGAVWNGRVAGRFRPGAYTARLVLRDPAGRVATAEQPVAVVRRGTGPCG